MIYEPLKVGQVLLKFEFRQICPCQNLRWEQCRPGLVINFCFCIITELLTPAVLKVRQPGSLSRKLSVV